MERLSSIEQHFQTPSMDYLTIVDSRTNRDYQIPIQNNVVKGQDLAKIQSEQAENLRVFDPGFANTAIMYSTVARGNTKASRLEFRGRNVYDLVDEHDFEEVAHLLLFDRVPNESEKQAFKTKLAEKCNQVSEHVEGVIRAFPKDAPYMTIMIAGLSAALAGKPDMIPAYHGSHRYSSDMDYTDDTIVEVIATYATCFALAYSHKTGSEFSQAEVGRSHIYNIFKMMGLVNQYTGEPDRRVLDIMEQWWIVSMDHELAHSTCATLLGASAQADPFSSVISGISSGYGILHLGATENSYRQQKSIGTIDRVKPVVEECKAGVRKLMGVGHRIYKKNNDPRLVIVKRLLGEMSSIGYADPLIATSYELEKQVNEDPFFSRKSLFINFDLYWWGLYTGLGIDINAVVPFFFCQRVVGLMSHFRELMMDFRDNPKNTKLWRPNMIYTLPDPIETASRRGSEDSAEAPRIDSVVGSTAVSPTMMAKQIEKPALVEAARI